MEFVSSLFFLFAFVLFFDNFDEALHDGDEVDNNSLLFVVLLGFTAGFGVHSRQNEYWKSSPFEPCEFNSDLRDGLLR